MGHAHSGSGGQKQVLLPADANVRVRFSMELPLPSDILEDAPEFYVRTITGSILADISQKKDVEIGSATLNFADTAAAIRRGRQHISYWCQEHDADMARVAADLFANEEMAPAMAQVYPGIYGIENIVVLARLEVLPPYRGQRIGSQVVEAIVDAYSSSCGLIVTKPFPFELEKIRDSDFPNAKAAKSEAFNEGIRRLQKFYERFGFRLVAREHMTYATNHPSQPGLDTCQAVHEFYYGRPAA